MALESDVWCKIFPQAAASFLQRNGSLSINIFSVPRPGHPPVSHLFPFASLLPSPFVSHVSSFRFACVKECFSIMLTLFDSLWLSLSPFVFYLSSSFSFASERGCCSVGVFYWMSDPLAPVDCWLPTAFCLLDPFGLVVRKDVALSQRLPARLSFSLLVWRKRMLFCHGACLGTSMSPTCLPSGLLGKREAARS